MSNAAAKSVALWVVRTLRKAGFEALFAGGCVRDMLLGQRSTDYDVATNATPEQVRKLFRRVLLVGAQFGVAMVIVDKRRVEVTTFRSEDSYSDGRRPDHVTFTTARQDAQRRDFTINGMFYDPVAREVIDYIGGQDDLKRRMIRTIGRAEQRFGEDYLRMVRAVRFAVRLGFEIEPATASAVRHHAPKIVGISGERVFDELSKMLAKPTAARALEKLAELDLARHILPELFTREGTWSASVARAAAVASRRNLTLTLAALLCDLEEKTITSIVRRWGGSNDLRDDLVFLTQHRDAWTKTTRPAESLARAPEEMSLADLKRLMANRNFERLVALTRVREQERAGRISATARLARRARQVPPQEISPPPLLTGLDLKKMGLGEGPRLGTILRALYDAQLNERIATREEALTLVRQLMEQT